MTEGYLEALGIPLIAGRYFAETDGSDTPPVAVISRALADRYWPGRNATGQRLKIGEKNSRHPWMTVAGIAGDSRQTRPDAPPAPELYVLHRLGGDAVYWTPQDLLVRSSVDPLRIAQAARREIRTVDSAVPVTEARTMTGIVDDAVAGRRVQATLLGVFAALAVLLAAIGVYGVTAYAVAQRTREIGLRMALGALPAGAFRAVMRKGVTLSLAGIAAGLAGALLLTRTLRTLLFGVTASDPATYIVVVLALLLTATLASYLPARRAPKVDPMEALRHE